MKLLNNPIVESYELEDGGGLRMLDTDKLMQKILADNVGKRDIKVPWSALEFSGINSLNVKGEGQFSFTDHSFRQMCEQLHMPVDYLKRCPTDGPASKQAQFEYWRDNIQDSELLLRVKNYPTANDTGEIGDLRAVLQHTWNPIDNLRIMQWTEDVIERHNDQIGIVYARIDSDSTHLRTCYKEPINLGTAKNPDPHYFGVHISDSETGGRALQLDYMLYRLSCTNGLIMKVEDEELLQQKHIHVDHTSLGRRFVEAFKNALDYRDQLVESLEKTRMREVKDPFQAIRKLVKHFKGTKEFAETVIAAYEEDPPVGTHCTKFHIINAFTRAARVMSMDKRHAVEAIAGQYLAEAA